MLEIPAGFVLDEVRVTIRPDLRFTTIYAGPAAAKGRHTNMSVPMILKQNDGATTAGATAPATSGNDDARMGVPKGSFHIDTIAAADAALTQPAAAATTNYQITSATAASSPDEEPPAHPPFVPRMLKLHLRAPTDATADAAPATGHAHGADAGPNAQALSAVAEKIVSQCFQRPSRDTPNLKSCKIPPPTQAETGHIITACKLEPGEGESAAAAVEAKAPAAEKTYLGKWIYKQDYIELRDPAPWCDDHGWKLWETANNRRWLTRTYRRWVPESDDEPFNDFPAWYRQHKARAANHRALQEFEDFKKWCDGQTRSEDLH